MKLPVEVAAKPGPFAGKFEKTLKSIPEKVVSEHISAQIEDDRIRIDFAPLAGKIEKRWSSFLLPKDLSTLRNSIERCSAKTRCRSILRPLLNIWKASRPAILCRLPA